MRKYALLLTVLFLFALFGCVSESTYAPAKKENVLSSEQNDLDGDGLWDYAVYEFSEVRAENSVKIKRRISVSTVTSAQYTSIGNLTDLVLLEADEYLEDATNEQKLDEESCSNRVGLMGATCIDVNTCANLCSANSIKCKRTAAAFKEFLGGSMIYFVQDNSFMDTSVYDARRNVLELRTSSENEKNLYLEDVRDAISRIAAINANPLVFHPALDLCDPADYGVEDLALAAATIGDYETETTGYVYTVTIEIEPVLEEGLANQMNGIEIEDSIPASALTDVNALSSHQDLSTSVQGSDLKIRWASSRISDEGYILYYQFDSETPPGEFNEELFVPSVTMKTLDLSALGPTNALFMMFLSMTGNYYFALGAAVGLTIALILLIYNVIVLAVSLAGAQLAERKIGYGIKKAFGRTRIEWKIDGAAAVILLIAGFYVSFYLATEPFEALTLVTSLEYLVSDPLAFAGTALVLLGVLLAYMAVENFVKIILLERLYGVTVREERSKYLKDIATLKKKLNTLKGLVKRYSAEEFEVTEEYNVISSISMERIREFERKMTPYSRTVLDEYIERIDSAIEQLEEKKQLADENWPEWKDKVSKLLSEQNEVYTSSLVNVPSSLRNWVLAKYVRESSEEGLILEESVIKRRKISPPVLIKEMVKDGYIKGGIILRKENVMASWFEGGKSPTVATALLFKLRSYMNSLQKTMDLGDLVSFASVGDDTVFVIMKTASYESAVFVNKDKFREAVEAWKKKIKMLGEV